MTLEGHSHTFDLNQLIEETGAKIQSLKNSAHENLSHQDETINEVMQTLEELTQDINTTDQQRRRIEKLKAEIDAMMQTQETIRDLQDKVITHIKKSTTPDLQVAGAATKLKDEFTVSEVYPGQGRSNAEATIVTQETGPIASFFANLLEPLKRKDSVIT